MSGIRAILSRLEVGRPVLLAADPVAALGSRAGPADEPAPIGVLVREAPELVAEHYDREIAAGADVVRALTAQTNTRALGRVGMAFRAAALTGAAVDLAFEAIERAVRPAAVAGVVGARGIGPIRADRVAEDYAVHAARLAAAGCEILVARGFGATPEGGTALARLARRAAVVAASATGLPTWAYVDIGADATLEDGEPFEDCVGSLVEAGATAILLEAPQPDIVVGALARAARIAEAVPIGALLADASGSTHAGWTRASSACDAPEHGLAVSAGAQNWADAAKALLDGGARIFGGGTGTTPLHTAALARALGRTDKTSIWPRAV